MAKMFLSPHKLLSDSIQLQMQIEAAKQTDGVDCALVTSPSQKDGADLKPSAQELSIEELKMRQTTLKLKVSCRLAVMCFTDCVPGDAGRFPHLFAAASS